MARSAALLPGEKTRFTLNVRLDGPPEPSGRFAEDNIVPALGFELQTFPPAP